MPTELRWCPGCRAERVFEMPPCADEHGADCPERACVECGGAVVTGHVLIAPSLVGDLVGPASPELSGAALVARTAVHTAAA
jgi:hypothetical protein